AVSFVERLRNSDGVDHARIFRMEEVTFDFKPYFRVEVGGEASAPAAPAAPAAPTPSEPAALGAAFAAPAPSPAPSLGGPAEGGGWMDLPLVDEPAAEAPAPEPFAAPEPFGAPEAPVAEAPAFAEPEATPPVFDASPPPPPPPPPALDEESVGTSNGLGARRGLFGR
ncbi:MAG: hypothetical protein KDB10_18590, partial [Acidimicrobiales bacterium]|nr:hypothetical protein [Acidimicrobiales bacterium]